METTKLLGERIKEALNENSGSIEASDLLKHKIHSEINNQKIKENYSMKKISTIKKIAVIAAALCCLTAISAFAIGKASSLVSSSSIIPVYTQLPTDAQLSKDVGFVPKYVERFTNGYNFKNANIDAVEGLNDRGESVGKYKQISYTYTYGGKDINVIVNKSEIPDKGKDDKKAKKLTYKGTDIYFSEQLYKFVPDNYKLTAEDIKAQKSGAIVFSYGEPDSKIVTSTFKYIDWSDADINYMIMARDSAMTEAGMTEMAKEIINK